MFRRKLEEVVYPCAEAPSGRKQSLWVELLWERSPATEVQLRRADARPPSSTESPQEAAEPGLPKLQQGDCEEARKAWDRDSGSRVTGKPVGLLE